MIAYYMSVLIYNVTEMADFVTNISNHTWLTGSSSNKVSTMDDRNVSYLKTESTKCEKPWSPHFPINRSHINDNVLLNICGKGIISLNEFHQLLTYRRLLLCIELTKIGSEEAKWLITFWIQNLILFYPKCYRNFAAECTSI